MKKPRPKVLSGPLRMFATVLFCTSLMNSLVTALAVYFLIHIGVLEVTASVKLGVGRLMLFFLLLSIPISLILSVLISRFGLKSIHELIAGMNKLASGDFKTRIHIGKVMKRYPAFLEMSNSFNQMAQELENTEVLRRDFINNFSHEFKTPIVSIAGFAQLLRHGALPSEQQQEYLQIIEEESLRLSDMATNVLNLSKVENLSILTDVTTYNLSEQLRSCMLLLENKWSRKNLELEMDFSEYTIHANAALLKQVWLNLLDNAIKFTPDGHLIQLTITQRQDALEVCVRNTGSQIPPASLPLIFQKFYQADASHSTQGNGVGLAIVQRIVELHGGKVQVVSRNSETCFTVILPQ